MKKEHIYYVIIGAGALVAALTAYRFLGSGPGTDPPRVLEQRILGDASVDEKRRAAQDMAKIGGEARLEIRRSLHQYQEDDPRVKISLIDATGRTRDWRSMPELFKAMESPNPVIRARAAEAAQRILGARFSFRANGTPEERAAVLAQMRRDYETMIADGRLAEFYADQIE
jgi:hypothetical protein